MDKTKRNIDNLVSRLLQDDHLIYLFIGSLMSSDNLIDVESCEKTIEIVNDILEYVETAKGIDEDEKLKLRSNFNNVLEIAERDKKVFENESALSD